MQYLPCSLSFRLHTNVTDSSPGPMQIGPTRSPSSHLLSKITCSWPILSTNAFAFLWVQSLLFCSSLLSYMKNSFLEGDFEWFCWAHLYPNRPVWFSSVILPICDFQRSTFEHLSSHFDVILGRPVWCLLNVLPILLCFVHNFTTTYSEHPMSLATFLVDFLSFTFSILKFLMALGSSFVGGHSSSYPPIRNDKQRSEC